MTNEERWMVFISELRNYIEIHHLGPSKHTDLYNQCRYYRRKLKEGTLSEDKARVLDEVLNLRHMDEHTGGRRKKQPFTTEIKCVK